jgi:sulfur-carrier protein
LSNSRDVGAGRRPRQCGVDKTGVNVILSNLLPARSRRGTRHMIINIPTPLRAYTDGQNTVEVDAASVASALQALTASYPDLRKHLFSGDGKVRAFVNLYLNDEDVRYLPAKESSPVSAEDTLSIIPSIAGGLAGTGRPGNAAFRGAANYELRTAN